MFFLPFLQIGSPLSAITANLLMENLEQACWNKLNSHVEFYKRYVDDYIYHIPVGKVDCVIHTFNSYHG